ncbi:MAG: hypothetical protein ACE5GK_06720 [Nitrospiria bacterium]
MMAKKVFVFLFLISAVFIVSRPAMAADTSKPIKNKIVKEFSEDYDRIWEATVAVFKEKGLGVHPHGKMKARKKKGKIKTPTFRYFKIWSAKPVVEKQYRDSYRVKIKKFEIEKPKPAGDAAAADAAPAKEEAAAGDATLKPGDTAETPPEAPPVEMITKVKMELKRKFEIHNDETRAWDKGDPNEHQVGYTLEYLLAAIEAKLANPGAASEKVTHANLNITPPVIVE